jgi:hypothetical protein
LRSVSALTLYFAQHDGMLAPYFVVLVASNLANGNRRVSIGA